MVEPLGEIEISEDVVADIAGHCASRIPGVVGMSEGLVGGISKFLRYGRPGQTEGSRGVKVEMAEKSASIDLSIAIEEGHPIPTVAAALQRSVKETVEKMTGLHVDRVNILVRDIVPLAAVRAAARELAAAPPEPAEGGEQGQGESEQ